MSEPLRLWSVTTLLKLGLGTSDPLVNWAVKTTAEYAIDHRSAWASLAEEDRDGALELLTKARYRKSGKASARGTDLHKAAEQLALGLAPEVEPEILPYVEQFRRFLTEHEPEFVMSEAPVYSPTRFYAGTCDGIVVLDGQRLVFDIKTTEHGPDSGRSRPPYGENALQLVAYRRAEIVGVLAEQRYASGKRYYLYDPDSQHEPMPETDGAIVLTISPHDYVITPVRTDDEVFRCFLAVREAARWQVDISSRVFGPQISAPVRQAA